MHANKIIKILLNSLTNIKDYKFLIIKRVIIIIIIIILISI